MATKSSRSQPATKRSARPLSPQELALQNLPYEDEELDPEEEADLRESVRSLAAGARTYSLAEVKRTLQRARSQRA